MEKINIAVYISRKQTKNERVHKRIQEKEEKTLL